MAAPAPKAKLLGPAEKGAEPEVGMEKGAKAAELDAGPAAGVLEDVPKAVGADNWGNGFEDDG